MTGRCYPALHLEQDLFQNGCTWIAGLDEAGRGAWAGPVAAAAVILRLEDPLLADWLQGVRDSKLCTAQQRERLYETIDRTALSWAAAMVSSAEIDRVGIVPATRLAMQQALCQLDPLPEALLIDALRLPEIALPQRVLYKGDAKCLSIAAASIMAKVTRDRAMVALDADYPDYGFGRHKGYGTPEHQEALQRLGPRSIHRWCFRPIAQMAQCARAATLCPPCSDS